MSIYVEQYIKSESRIVYKNDCEPFHNRGVASTGYVLRVRFLATERRAETLNYLSLASVAPRSESLGHGSEPNQLVFDVRMF